MLLSISKSMFKEYNFEKHHTIFKLKENEENILLTDILEMHFLEMKKVKTLQQNDKLGQWLTFIKADSVEGGESMAKVNRDIDKAYDILKTMSCDEKTRMEYLSREMALHDEATRIDEAIKEGIEQGSEQGKKQEKIELARNLLDILDDETIALKVGLDIKEVKKIRKEFETGK